MIKLEKIVQNKARDIFVNERRVSVIENPTNLGGIGGATLGRNPIRVIFVDGTLEMVAPSAFDTCKGLQGFVEIGTDTNTLLINTAMVSMVAQDTVDPNNDEWFAHLPPNTRIPVPGPEILEKPKKERKRDERTAQV